MRRHHQSAHLLLAWLTASVGFCSPTRCVAQELLKELKPPPGRYPRQSSLQCPAFSFDGKLLAAIGQDIRLENRDVILIFNVAEGKLIQTLRDTPTSLGPVCFTPDGKSLVCITEIGKDKSEAKVRDVASGKVRLTFAIRSPGFPFITPDGKTLIVSGHKGEAATLYDLTTGKEIAEFKQDADGPPQRIALSPDGKLLATVHVDRTERAVVVTVWDLARRRSRDVFSPSRGVAAIAFSPDGKYLVTGAGSELTLWNLTTGKAVEQEDVRNGLWSIQFLAFTPDGKRLVVAGAGIVRLLLWDVKEWKLAPEFQPEKPTKLNRFSYMALSPDGKILATVLRDEQVIRLMKLPPPKPEK